MENMSIFDQCRSVPEEAKKPIKGGRLNGMTDINPMWRYQKLTELFGPCGIGWYYTVSNKWVETYGDEVAVFVDIELYIKQDGSEWSKPIHGTGGSMFAAKERTGVHVSDECYKMATTDAVSVACKQLGIGADVYWAQGADSKYNTIDTPENKKAENQKPARKEPVYITQTVLNTLAAEMKRTGIGGRSLLNSYGLKDYTEMTVEQFKNAMEVFKAKPDKEVPPKATEAEMACFTPLADNDCDLPWN